MNAEILHLLACPRCGSSYRAAAADGGADWLVCLQCAHRVPVIEEIPRFVQTPEDETAKRTQASFGYEWTHFNDWSQSGHINFNDYFQGIDLTALVGRLVLDAGCGMGRHARQIAPFAGNVVAADFSRAIDEAKRNTAVLTNVTCIQADVLALPLLNASFDFVYSMGVLHHLADTERALEGLVSKLKLGGTLRIYLYWKRHGLQGRLLSLVSLMRRITTRLPFQALRVLCWILSVVLYGAVILPYRLLSRMGMQRHTSWPLFVYAKYPFAVLYNDQFDRFSAPIEKRYDPDEVRELLRAAGLSHIHIRPCFGWIADGVKLA
jgi:SAM-dependent methyltransferase